MTVEQALKEALRLHEARQYAEAEALYRQILVQQPNQPDALHLLGVLSYELGRFDAAIDFIRRALAFRPDFLEAKVNLGAAYQQAGHLEQAIETFQQALQINSNIAAIHNNLGNALQAAGRTEDAIISYRRAIQLDPKISDAHYNLANVLRAKHRLDQAIASYRQAIALRPDYVEAHSHLAIALLGHDDLDQALAPAQKAVLLGPNSPDAYNCLGVVLRVQGKLDEALAAFTRAIALKPDYAEAYGNLGNVFSEDGQYEQAIAAYQKSIAINPNAAEVHSHLGSALKYLGQIDDAIAACRRGVAVNPNSVHAQLNLLDVLRAKGYVDKSVVAYSQAIAVVPHLSDPHCAFGNVVSETRGPNLVLGMAWNLKVQDVRVFVESLRRYYQGDVMMLVTSQGSEELISYLRSHGITPVYFDAQIWMLTDVMAGRFVRYAEILRGVGKEYQHVLLTDVTDVLFQADPFAELPEGELLCFLEGRGTTFAESPLNAYWVRSIFGRAEVQKIKHCEMSCAGTTIGSHKAILDYIDHLLEHVKPALFAKLPRCNLGYDQGIHNFLLLSGALPNARILPNGRHIYTLALVELAEIGLGPAGTILSPDGSLCPIIHQYNFKPELFDHIRTAHPALHL